MSVLLKFKWAHEYTWNEILSTQVVRVIYVYKFQVSHKI